MQTEKFLIAGGNPTLLVWGCPIDKQVSISKQELELGDAEQVGFITNEHDVMYLTMMGNELCINASLALASVSGERGKFFTRGIDYLVSYTNTTNWTTIEARLPFTREGTTILFEGIGYACYSDDVIVTKEKVVGLAEQYNLPAFGIIICKNNAITPHVYVAETGSLVHESACGSGSIAASIILATEDIIQPSGETIKIKGNGDVFTVSARVRLLRDFTYDLGSTASHPQPEINNGIRNIT